MPVSFAVSGDVGHCALNVELLTFRFWRRGDCKRRRVQYILTALVVQFFLQVHARPKAGGSDVLLIAVAAVLVASIRLHFLDALLHLRYRGPNIINCDASFAKGEEMGWFQRGSTIIVFAPSGYELCPNIQDGEPLRVGAPLMAIRPAEPPDDSGA